jgi:Zn-dependent protease with chaperone function
MSAACEAQTMAVSGEGIFFDGTTSARLAVTVTAAPDAVVARDADGSVRAHWRYDELEQLAAPEGVLRLGLRGDRSLERIEVRDTALATAIDKLSVPVDRTGTSERRSRHRVVLWSVLAGASLLLIGVYGVPLLANQIAPFVPYPLERRLGAVIETQVRDLMDPGQQGRSFECGWTGTERAGRVALEGLVGKLEAAAHLPIPLTLIVVRKQEANAMALPGGHIFVYQGLITKAHTPDEVAGVIAHEIGHVAHRDGTRSMLQTAGLSFVFGLVLGDFVGGGALMIAGKTMLSLAYSRDVEAAADRYSVDLMTKAGGDPRALAAILGRIAGAIEPGAKVLMNHPDTRDRLAAINARASAGTTAPLLDAAQWAALKRICAGH